MEARLERLYGRLGRKYALLFVAWITIVAIVTGGFFVSATIAYLQATKEELPKIFLPWQLNNAISLGIIVLLARRTFRHALRWGAGERTPEVAAHTWNELTFGVPRLCATGVLVFCGLGLVSVINAVIVLELPWYSVPLIFVGMFVVVATAAMLDYFGVEQLYRPVMRELAQQLPVDFEPSRPSVGVGWRVFGAMTTISFVAALIAAQPAATDLTPAGRLGVGVGAAFLVTCSVGLAMTLFLNRSLVTPIDDLIAATRRVEEGEFDKPVTLLAADQLGVLTQSFNRMMTGLKEREVLFSAMGVYVDPEVAARVLEEGNKHDGLLLAGQDIELTMMFLDIRDFTAFAERHSPEETVRYLNDFFALVVPLLAEQGGHVNKFLGDGVFAVFGAPVYQPDHADRALAAAKAIVRAVHAAYSSELRIGVGINSGNVVVGSVGGGGRLEFTLIGDAVNVAARVEQLTKETCDEVLITEATRGMLSNPVQELESRGWAVVRGRADEVHVFALSVTDDGVTAPSSGGQSRPLV